MNCTPKTRQFPAPVTLGKSTVSTLIGYLSIPLATCCTKVGTPGSGVPVGVGVAVAVAVAVGDGVAVGLVGVAVGVAVDLGVGVAVVLSRVSVVVLSESVSVNGVAIGVAVGVTVGVGAGGGVGLSLGVGSGSGCGIYPAHSVLGTAPQTYKRGWKHERNKKGTASQTKPRARHLLRAILVSNLTRTDTSGRP